MRFARRLAVCVLTVLAVSVLAAMLWDQPDPATPQPSQAVAADRPAQP